MPPRADRGPRARGRNARSGLQLDTAGSILQLMWTQEHKLRIFRHRKSCLLRSDWTSCTEPAIRRTQKMITVMGATGNTGRKTTELLLDAGEEVRALGRSPDKLAELDALGADIVA